MLNSIHTIGVTMLTHCPEAVPYRCPIGKGGSANSAFKSTKRWSDACRLPLWRKEVMDNIFDKEAFALEDGQRAASISSRSDQSASDRFVLQRHRSFERAGIERFVWALCSIGMRGMEEIE